MPDKIVFKQINIDPSLAYLTMIGIMANMQGWSLKKTLELISDHLYGTDKNESSRAFAETLKVWDPRDCTDITTFSTIFLATVYEWFRITSQASDKEAAAIVMHIGEHLPDVAQAIWDSVFGNDKPIEGPTRKGQIH